MTEKSLRRDIAGALAIGCVAVLAALTGCAGSAADGDEPTPTQSRFVSPTYHLAFDYPADIESQHGLQDGYFFNGRWNPDAPVDVPGDGLLTLTLPASNGIRFAMLRLGASHDPRAASTCRLPRQRRPHMSVHTRMIDGVAFHRVDSGDAGMSHYLRRRSYRGVHDGACIAIDLVVAGTDPGVYDAPPPTPFSVAAVFQQLTALLDGLSFSD